MKHQQTLNSIIPHTCYPPLQNLLCLLGSPLYIVLLSQSYHYAFARDSARHKGDWRQRHHNFP